MGFAIGPEYQSAVRTMGKGGRAMIEKPTHGEQPRPITVEMGRTAGNYRIFRRWRALKFIVVAAAVLIALLVVISGWLQKWLWMRQVGYSGVFWTLWNPW